ncbi:unnamed protein product [Rangifer tarandus platyrhynchus]|uniref:Uncharacterized protein n=1 Tax=Rangifer tarandus platyrhynchus TaxID=3082113 RepID=A0AC59Z4B2_RANTA
MDCNLPGSSVHGIFWARTLEWVAISSPGDLPDPGIEPGSPALQADSLPTELRGKPHLNFYYLSHPVCGLLEQTNSSLWAFLVAQTVKDIPAMQETQVGLGRPPGEGNGNALQYSGLENSMDGGACLATVHGLAKSRTGLRDNNNASMY